MALTVAYVAFSVYVSTPWRSDLRRAIGSVMAWVIPISLAYVPGVLIGFIASTLLTVRYRVPPPQPPTGSWREGQWPPVTVVGAAWNEERAIVPTLERIAGLAYAGPLEVVLADNNSTDRTAERAQQTAERLGLDYRRIFQPTAGKHHALNTPLESVTTPLVTTVDADTLLHPAALTYLVAQGAFSAYWTEDVRAVGG